MQSFNYSYFFFVKENFKKTRFDENSSMFTFSFSSFHFPNVGLFRIRFFMPTPQPLLNLIHFWWKGGLKMCHSYSGAWFRVLQGERWHPS